MENFKQWRSDILDRVTIHISENPFIRYGQSVSIISYTINSDVYDELVGTKYDCFYVDEKVDIYLEKFYGLLKTKNNE